LSPGSDGAALSRADFAEAISAYTKQSVAAIGGLSKINVSSATGGQDAVALIDTAISDVAQSRDQISAYQSETLQALQTSVQPLPTIATSPTENTDFAQETAAFTQQNVLLQSGTQVLKVSQQTSQLVLSLLQGL
jgi:flagellin